MRLNHHVDLRHDPYGLAQGDDDAVVVLGVFFSKRPARFTALGHRVLQLFLAYTVAADVEVPHLEYFHTRRHRIVLELTYSVRVVTYQAFYGRGRPIAAPEPEDLRRTTKEGGNSRIVRILSDNCEPVRLSVFPDIHIAGLIQAIMRTWLESGNRSARRELSRKLKFWSNSSFIRQ